MSDYHREKVLRIPMEDMGINPADYDDIGYDLYEKYGDMFYWNRPRVGKFDVAPTEEWFLDFVIEEEYGACCGEWGKVRELTLDEKIKYYLRRQRTTSSRQRITSTNNSNRKKRK